MEQWNPTRHIILFYEYQHIYELNQLLLKHLVYISNPSIPQLFGFGKFLYLMNLEADERLIQFFKDIKESKVAEQKFMLEKCVEVCEHLNVLFPTFNIRRLLIYIILQQISILWNAVLF